VTAPSTPLLVAAVVGGFAILAVAIAILLVQRSRLSGTERAWRERHEHLRLIVEQTPAMMWTVRPDSTLDFLNRTCTTFSGLPMEKLLDEGWLDAVHPDDLDRCVGVYVPAVEARRPFVVDYRLRHADGSYRWLLATGVPKYEADGRFSGFIGCDVDITERKAAEDQIQYLAGRLIGAQEIERARIARDLHDDVSQQLAGVSIAFSGLKQRLGEYHVSDEMQQELVELQQQTLTLARNLRQLSHDLHPTVLQHLGLVKGLTSYCGELQRAHGLSMTCTSEGDFRAITPDAALCVYRIAQEALRNVIAHAGATRADVRLRLAGDQAEITIADDGRGFDTGNRLEKERGLGLVSISERARIIGGTVSVVSRLNQGTQVQATIPLNGRAKLDAAPGMAGQVA
jgi:PAS domain S-box-containing protein